MPVPAARLPCDRVMCPAPSPPKKMPDLSHTQPMGTREPRHRSWGRSGWEFQTPTRGSKVCLALRSVWAARRLSHCASSPPPLALLLQVFLFLLDSSQLALLTLPAGTKHYAPPRPLTPGALQSIAFMHFSSRHGACPVSCPTDTACGDIAPSCLPPREQKGETPALSTRRLHPVTKWALSGRRGLERRNQLRAPVWNLALVAESAVTWCLTFTDDGKKKKNHMRRRETTLRDERCSAHPVYPTRWAVNESTTVTGAGRRGWARASGKAGSWVLTGCVLQSSAVLVCEPGLTTGDGQCRPGPAARGEPGAGLAR